jgi:riboflavin kinase/FMN adenylyltransferase
MQVIDWARFLESGLPLGEKLSSMTVGVFDGVHRGHQALIERVVSHNADYVPVVVTFRQNHKTEETGGLQTFHQKIEVLESLGVKITLVIDFTETFKRMAGIEFLEILLKHGNIGFFAVGSSFRCGFQLDTDAVAIQNFFATRNIPAEIVPEVLENGAPISSSRIRSAIAGGDLSLAEKMLGRSFSMTSKTINSH